MPVRKVTCVAPTSFCLVCGVSVLTRPRLAIEEAVRHSLRCSLPQTSFIHNSWQAFVTNPVREFPSPLLRVTLPFLYEFWLKLPFQFRCWITRRISPNGRNAILPCGLALHVKGLVDGSYHFGFTSGNFLQLAFPCTKDFKANSTHFVFAMYILSASVLSSSDIVTLSIGRRVVTIVSSSAQ